MANTTMKCKFPSLSVKNLTYITFHSKDCSISIGKEEKATTNQDNVRKAL